MKECAFKGVDRVCVRSIVLDGGNTSAPSGRSVAPSGRSLLPQHNIEDSAN